MQLIKRIITFGVLFVFAALPQFVLAATDDSVIVGPNISSATHPDQNLWYPKSEVDLAWSRPDNAYGFSFELDQNPRTVPDDILDTTKTTSKTYTELKDGTWFFHIKARPEAASSNFGPTRNFRILVDATTPEAFVISLVNESYPNSVSANPMIAFKSTDSTSGINHYLVLLDNMFIEKNAVSPFSFGKIGSGPHLIKVVAVDVAGNEKVSTLPVIVGAVPTTGLVQNYINVPVYLFFILILLAIGLFVSNLRLIFGYTRRPKRNYGFGPIANLQSEIDLTLEKMRSEIDEQLLNLHARSSEEFMSKQTEVVKAITADITKTKRKIDAKINPRPKRVRKYLK